MAELASLVSIAANIGIALLLGLAAVRKLQNVDDWLKALAAYKLVPAAMLTLVAYTLPAFEILAATFLFISLFVDVAVPAAVLAGALLALFSAAIAINLLRGRTQLDCGCDPRGRAQPISWAKVCINLGLIALLALALMPLPALDVPMTAMAAITGTVSYVLLQCVGDLTALGQSLPKMEP